jgi:hypothetical protein
MIRRPHEASGNGSVFIIAKINSQLKNCASPDRYVQAERSCALNYPKGFCPNGFTELNPPNHSRPDGFYAISHLKQFYPSAFSAAKAPKMENSGCVIAARQPTVLTTYA